jgi:hypothetical protein
VGGTVCGVEDATRWLSLVNNPSESFGEALRRIRQERGWSLRRLSKETNFDYTHLSYVERDKNGCSEELVRRCEQALDAHGQLLRTFAARGSAGKIMERAALRDTLVFSPVPAESVSLATGLWRADLDARPEVRQAPFSAGAFIAPAMRWLTVPEDEPLPRNDGTAVDLEDVDPLREMAATFRMLDNKFGWARMRETVVRYLDAEVTPLLLGRFDSATGEELFASAAELTRLAGWMSYDAGLHGLAQRCLIQALRLAATAGNHELGAEILATMSQQAIYLRCPTEAIDLARAARHAAGEVGVAALTAEALVAEAHGHSLRGDEKACAVALDRAEHALDQADRSKDPDWISYLDEAYLAARFAHCFSALERGDLAGPFAQRSLTMDDRYRRGKQFNLALRAITHAQANEPEQAGRVGIAAISATKGVRSARSVDYLRQLAIRLAPHAGLPAVADFLERARPLLDRER